MKPDDFDDERENMAALHRAATDAFDERPAARVRAAVLAEAARMAPAPTFGTRHWPRSLAAVLVVSVLAGLVFTRVVRDEPERLAPQADRTVAVAAPPVASATPPAPVSTAPVDPQPPTGSPRSATMRPPPPRTTPRASMAPHEKASPQAETAAPATADAAKPSPAVAFAAPPEAPPSQDVAAPRAKIAETPQHATAVPAPVSPRVDERARSESPPTGGDRFARVARIEGPETIVARIVRLRRDGRDDDADRLLATLRSRYPDFVVPPEALRPVAAP